MAHPDKMSPVKKLPEAIEAGSAAQNKTYADYPGLRTGGGRRRALGRGIISASKKITLGVDIGRAEVRIVKAARISSDRWEMLDCVRIPFKSGISRGDSLFYEFLRSSVSAIAGPDGRCDVWTQVSPANLDVRYIKIPKVPKAQIPNAVYWTVKRETNFDEKESIIDFEVQGDVLEKGTAKIGIIAYVIPRKDLDEIREVFSRSGLTLSGITVAPFAIQNLFRSGCVPRHDKPVGVLLIGREYSRIDIFSNGNLLLTRGIKAGIDSMIEAFTDEADDGKWRVTEGDGEEFLTVSENEANDKQREAKALLLRIFSGSLHPDESIGSTGLHEEDVFEMVKPALGRLAKQVERTFEHFSLTLQNERVDTIYISSVAGHWERPFDFIAEQLGVERKVLDPLCQGAIQSDDVVKPAAVAERTVFTTAVGLALSDNTKTPNLILTYRDKVELRKVARTDRVIFSAFVAIVLILTGIFFLQARLARQKEAKLALLQEELDKYSPQPNQNMIAALAAKVIAERRTLAERSNRLLGAAVIGELASLTPPNVRLLSLRAVLGDKPGERDKKGASAGETKEAAGDKKDARKVVLEGIVTGRRDAQEASLAGYLVKLSASRLFVHPVVSSNMIESYPDYGEVLRFSLELGLP